MKKFLTQAVCMMLGLSMTVLTAACGGDKTTLPLDSAHGIADQSKLFGMCYLMEERDLETLDIEAEAQLMANLGVKSVRHWMHFSHFMSDKQTLKTDATARNNMHAMLAACTERGIMNIGMNHHNFCAERASGVSPTSKPYARDVSDGSLYVAWLNDYYTSWYTLVTEFPEVEYWEIDNEVNNPDFMRDSEGKASYSLKQMAEMATDMFYYGSRAIHDANPNAKTVMGSLTEPAGLGRGNTATFLQMIYDNIASGDYGYFYGKEQQATASKNADDYFEIACWHPYMADFRKAAFIELNNEYYDIILKNEKKHKKVFFTELGWDDAKVGGEAESTRMMTELFDALTEMPYVETAQIFKLYDVGKENTWDSSTYVRFGLFYDPDTVTYPVLGHDRDTALNIDADGNCINGAPKNKAYAFQQMAGGSGSLDLLRKDRI